MVGPHDQGFIDHEKRISTLEANSASAAASDQGLWGAVDEIRKGMTAVSVDIAKVGTTSNATLTSVGEILAKMEKYEDRTRTLEKSHADAGGAMKVVIGIAAMIGAGISGAVTYIVTHLFSPR
jgi:hypothetical protein